MLLEPGDSEDDVVFQIRCDGHRHDFSMGANLEGDVGKMRDIGSFSTEADDRAWLRQRFLME